MVFNLLLQNLIQELHIDYTTVLYCYTLCIPIIVIDYYNINLKYYPFFCINLKIIFACLFVMFLKRVILILISITSI